MVEARLAGSLPEPIERGGVSDWSQAGRAVLLLGGGEASPQAVLRDDARDEEVLEIFAAAGFRTATAQLETTERLAAHDRAGDAAIDVEVAANHLRLRPLDIHRAARVEAAGQRERAVVGGCARAGGCLADRGTVVSAS